jgi:hypothetical protein
MKQRRSANQLQAGLFDRLGTNDDPSLLEVPADRSLELEAAVGELLLRAAGRIESGGDDHDN